MATGRIAASRFCSVYLIRAATGQVKIGRSAKPERRIAGIQTGSPVRVELVHAWKMKTAEAVAVERALHRLFKWARVSGEWHAIDYEIVRGVGDVFLAGDVKRAEQLSVAALTEDRCAKEWKRLSKEAREPGLRFRPDDRAEAIEDAGIAYDILLKANDERRALGVSTEAELALDSLKPSAAMPFSAP
jgi:hypothetical protein